MNRIRRSALKKWLYGLLALALLIAAGVAAAQSQEPGSEKHAAALLKKHEMLTEQLAHNPYRRPLVLDSSETHNAVYDNAYAVLDSPFSTFSATFKSPDHWCEVLILHNYKTLYRLPRCRGTHS